MMGDQEAAPRATTFPGVRFLNGFEVAPDLAVRPVEHVRLVDAHPGQISPLLAQQVTPGAFVKADGCEKSNKRETDKQIVICLSVIF
jgi:hypothetical protein